MKSSVLGSPHEYRTRFSDKFRLVSAVIHADASANLACKAKGDKDWVERPHDQLQLRALLAEMDDDEDGGHASHAAEDDGGGRLRRKK